MNLLDTLSSLQLLIGNTPIRPFRLNQINCFMKLEYNNLTGSVKDRAAFNIVFQGIREGKITENVTLIESSSGNFAVSLATICNHLQLRFIGVIDPNVNSSYEKLLNLLAYKIIKVTERDETGGFLLNRIRKVKKICEADKNMFWTDQYENPDNYLAYYNGLGVEVGDSIKQLDYAFIAVSSCGTITGLSQRLKKRYPGIKIIGVDIEGSLIFQEQPMKRHVSGIGSSQKSSTILHAFVDEVIHVSHDDIINGCWELLRKQSAFVGASTGATYSAIKMAIAKNWIPDNANVLFLACDRGNAYLDTIYDKQWIERMSFVYPVFSDSVKTAAS